MRRELMSMQLYVFHLAAVVRASKAAYDNYVSDLYKHLIIRTPLANQTWALAQVLENTPKEHLQYSRRVSFINSHIGAPDGVELEEHMNLLIRLLLKDLPNLSSFHFEYRLCSFGKRASSGRIDSYSCLTGETIRALLSRSILLREVRVRTTFPARILPGEFVPRLRSLEFEFSAKNVHPLLQLLSAS